MPTQLTPEQKKERRKLLVMGMLGGAGIAIVIMMIINRKETDKLKARIMELEGWQ